MVGFADRERLKDTLGLVLAKTLDEKRAFGACFDLFFKRGDFSRRPAGGGSRRTPSPPGQAAGKAARARAAGAAAAAGADAAGRRPGGARRGDGAGGGRGRPSNIRFFTQVNLYTRRILERMGLQALERDIAAAPDAERTGRLRQGRERLREQVKDLRRAEPGCSMPAARPRSSASGC